MKRKTEEAKVRAKTSRVELTPNCDMEKHLEGKTGTCTIILNNVDGTKRMNKTFY